MKIYQYILLPLSWLYGFVVFLRNKLFDFDILPSVEFDRNVIGIGNLCMGGSGKTPMTIYIAKLIKDHYKTALLSRGYGRKSSGFRYVEEHSTSNEVGDEPRLYRSRFKNMLIAVDASRSKGIKKILQDKPDTQVFLLDDAFQHRSVKAGLSVLLTDYRLPFYKDFLIPSGSLREWRSGYQRADLIVVTKTPENFNHIEKRIILKELNPFPHQHVFFSYLKYSNPIHFISGTEFNMELLKEERFAVLMFTGIANAAPMKNYLVKFAEEIVELSFPDHHSYSEKNISEIVREYNKISNTKKLILTTEKDVMRLDNDKFKLMLAECNVHYLPVEMAFHDNDGEEFNQKIIHYAKYNKING